MFSGFPEPLAHLRSREAPDVLPPFSIFSFSSPTVCWTVSSHFSLWGTRSEVRASLRINPPHCHAPAPQTPCLVVVFVHLRARSDFPRGFFPPVGYSRVCSWSSAYSGVSALSVGPQVCCPFPLRLGSRLFQRAEVHRGRFYGLASGLSWRTSRVPRGERVLCGRGQNVLERSLGARWFVGFEFSVPLLVFRFSSVHH